MATQITKFTRKNLTDIRDEIDTALNAILAKRGLSASLGNISFTESDFNVKVKVSCGSNDEADEREFKEHAFKFGLTGNEFGKSFKHGGNTFTVVGIKPKSTKYPILGKNAKGKLFKFRAESVKTAA